MNETSAASALTCIGCGLAYAPSLLLCPGCQRLTHRERLQDLAGRAGTLQEGGELHAALSTWRDALALLPQGTAQHRQVAARVQALVEQVRDLPAPPDETGGARGTRGSGAAAETSGEADAEAGTGSRAGKWAAAGGLALLLLSKGKWLLLGLSKGKTMLSMLAFAGIYWTVFGWWFAVGLVVGIYIHEMGHVAALRRLGIAASAPMFIPGIGAFIRMKQYPSTPSEDARVGLAGPVWGAAASIGFYVLHILTDTPELAAIAAFNAWINLFNLLPLGPLDGGRAMNAMTRPQRWICVAALGAAFLFSDDRLILLLIVVAAYRAAMAQAPREPDASALRTYVVLVLLLTAITQVPVPGVTPPADAVLASTSTTSP